MSHRVVLENRKTAFANRLMSFAIINLQHIDIENFLNDAFTMFEDKVGALVNVQNIIKVGACLIVEYEKNDETMKLHVYCEYDKIDVDTNMADWFKTRVIDKVLKRVEEFELNGSGWQFLSIIELEVGTNLYDVIRGSSYIELPKFLKDKKAIINVENVNDEYCFKWTVLSALFPRERNPQRCSVYREYEDRVNFIGLEFPMKLSKISKFEEMNPTISINVYAYDEVKKIVYPIRLTKNVKESHIHMLLLSDTIGEGFADIEEKRRTHYCWIKNMSRLIRNQITKSNRMIHFCDRCLQHFTSSIRLDEHIPNCMERNGCRIIMPDETKGENIIRFKNYHKKLDAPFVIYADVESILKKPTDNFCNSETTKAYQQHETFCVGLYFLCHFDPSLSFYDQYSGPDCTEWFANRLHKIACDVAPILRRIIPLNMSERDEREFQNAQDCHICETPILYSGDKVRDHCHLTGKYRGAAHSRCNLTYEPSKTIPVVFHNLSGYDAHFIIRQISTQFEGDVSIIPVTDQNYISFTKTVDDATIVGQNAFKNGLKLKFIDSFRFMSSSLDKLAAYLPSEKKIILRKEFGHLSDEKRALLERKGVFPYDYIDSYEKLNETRLPSRDHFYSKLTESEISESEYEFAQKIWKEFDIQTIREYSDLYLKTDVLLLADVFENFRTTCMNIYKLDPAHYFTAPGYSWDAMLLYTSVQIELFTDVDMLLFVERGIRGGISQCSGRYFEANNKYMQNFEPSRPPSYLMYLDVNNLYGDAMMKSLPLNGFEWCDGAAIDVEMIKHMTDDSPVGYILEVDLEYPTNLHDCHKDYPLCAETRVPPGSKHEKLLLTLFDKTKYVIHYTMLKFVLQQGLVLKKIHRALKFNQSKWLKPYIALNTDQRTIATNDFEKNLYKLMSNAVYGKTMENMRTRVDIKLKTYWHGRYGAAELIAKPHFKRVKIFDENLVAIEMSQSELNMNKPVVIGMSVLDISKVVMCDFHYNYMKPKYGENVEVLYTDTDSFIYKILCDDFYADMKKDVRHKYDTSDYAVNNVYEMPRENKKVPGLMKDENNGKIMTEFVGLRSKMYSVRVNNQDAIKKAKGVKKYVLKKSICFDDYLTCIQTNCIISLDQNSIRSKNHVVYTITQKKIALSGKDDKRYILPDGIKTLPHGHYSLRD